MRLSEVESFGAVDADADKLLDACFEDHEAYREAKSHSKFLILVSCRGDFVSMASRGGERRNTSN